MCEERIQPINFEGWSAVFERPPRRPSDETFWINRWPASSGLDATRAELVEAIIGIAAEAAMVLRAYPSLQLHNAQRAASEGYHALWKQAPDAPLALSIYGSVRDQYLAAIEATGWSRARNAVPVDGGFIRIGTFPAGTYKRKKHNAS